MSNQKDKNGTDQSKQCSECGKEFPTRIGRRRHEATCNIQSRRCRLCNKTLTSRRNLENHEVSCRERREKAKLLKQAKDQSCPKSVPNSSIQNTPEATQTATTGWPLCRQTPHSRRVTRDSRFVCGVCDKGFRSLRELLRHRETHYERITRFICPVCKQQFTSQQLLAKHLQNHPTSSNSSNRDTDFQGDDGKQKKLKCVDCGESFEHWHQLLNHRTVHRSNPDSMAGNVLPPWEVNPNIRPPWVETDEDGNQTINEDFKSVYEQYRPTINAHHDVGQVRGIYNFPVNDFSGESEVLFDHLNYVFSQENHSFKINLAFGVILRHIETGQYRYYTPYYNTSLFDRPVVINNRNDMMKLFRKLESLELLDLAMKTRESTKWQKVFITNVNYFVYRTGFPIGSADEVVLPDHILRKVSIRGMHKSTNNQPYRDNLCVFRCLTWSKEGGRGPNFENQVRGYYTEWTDYRRAQDRENLPLNPKKYKGITMDDLPDFEQCFNVRVSVYSLHADDSCTRLYTSALDSEQVGTTELYLNLYDTHFSLITDFNAYASKFACRFCGRTFQYVAKLKIHERSCDNRVKYTYPGGLYTPSQTVFEEMQETLGIRVDEQLQFYPWFAVFDFEAVLKKIPQDVEEASEPATRWTTEHVPICVSVSSNVPGYDTPHCIIDPNPDSLVESMCEYLRVIQSATAALAAERWVFVFQKLEEVHAEFPSDPIPPENPDGDQPDNIEEPLIEVDFGFDDTEQNEPDHEETRKIHAKRVEKIMNKFKKYTEVLPVLGFNSSRYDLNLIKLRLPKHLNLAKEADYIVKKTNQYSAIVTSKFKFLDISNFLAAGCSYSKFLIAYLVEEAKGYYPYDWFDDVSKLDAQTLPSYEEFYSDLKKANVLDIEHRDWVKNGQRGVPPKTGREKYEDLLILWQTKGMTRFSDYLEHYVNLDTGPFVQAAEKLKKYYFDMGIDVFKVAISAPGVARKLLFGQARKDNIHFASFSKDEADLYHKIKKCVFGGPSIIFKRYAKVNETCIRNNPEVLCKNILGFDCNSLYLWALGEPLAVLFPIRRLEETHYKPQVSWKHLEMYQWMNWLMLSEGIHIQHKMNSGREFPVGPYRLDGYYSDGTRSFGLDFHGCWTHGHDPIECGFRRGETISERVRGILSKRRDYTKHRDDYIRSRGIELKVIYECEFAQMKREDPQIKAAIRDMFPDFYWAYPHQTDMATILENVESGHLTGLIQVDIHVPDRWPEGREREMTPKEYFSEMSPIFCNSEVHFNDWGPTMQKYSMSNHAPEFSASKKLLIGGMAAEKIFLATCLLKWYLEKGLVVTRVYEVVEYKFQKCFEGFCEYISEARRKADSDPSTQILAETAKTLGNASYGSLLLDKTKHINVKYVEEKSKAHLEVNDPLFKRLTELPDHMYEIEKSKKSIPLDLPIHLGFLIVNYAKVKLLSFYYDFLDYYLERKDFEITHIDTDSMYFTLSGSELSEVVIPTRQQEFEQSLHGHCNDQPYRASDGHWLPRRCCERHKLHDKRERGLFKLEASGTELIALASKTYYLRRPDLSDCVKAKGINRSAIVDPEPLYRKALFEMKSSSVSNVGFRARDSKIMTYSQQRRGFSFFYVKREVQPNGIDTKPLPITLNPWEKYNVVVLNRLKHCLSNDYQSLIVKNGKYFRSCTHLFLYEKAVFNGCLDIAQEILKSKKEAQLHSAARGIKVQTTWFQERDGIMEEVIRQKVLVLKHRIISELRLFSDKMIVHPGDDGYFTCGLSEKLAQITAPHQYPGEDALSRFWERVTRDEDFMNS